MSHVGNVQWGTHKSTHANDPLSSTPGTPNAKLKANESVQKPIINEVVEMLAQHHGFFKQIHSKENTKPYTDHESSKPKEDTHLSLRLSLFQVK